MYEAVDKQQPQKAIRTEIWASTKGRKANRGGARRNSKVRKTEDSTVRGKDGVVGMRGKEEDLAVQPIKGKKNLEKLWNPAHDDKIQEISERKKGGENKRSLTERRGADSK